MDPSRKHLEDDCCTPVVKATIGAFSRQYCPCPLGLCIQCPSTKSQAWNSFYSDFVWFHSIRLSCCLDIFSWRFCGFAHMLQSFWPISWKLAQWQCRRVWQPGWEQCRSYRDPSWTTLPKPLPILECFSYCSAKSKLSQTWVWVSRGGK